MDEPMREQAPESSALDDLRRIQRQTHGEGPAQHHLQDEEESHRDDDGLDEAGFAPAGVVDLDRELREQLEEVGPDATGVSLGPVQRQALRLDQGHQARAFTRIEPEASALGADLDVDVILVGPDAAADETPRDPRGI